MGKKILTLNIGASAIALAEYEGSGRRLKLVNYGTAALAAPLDSGDADAILTPALWEIMRAKGIRPGKVAVSISGQMVFPRVATIPAMGNGERFEQYVRSEIEQNVPFPIDEMVCDRQVLGDTEAGDKSVMIVAAKTEQVEAITGALQSAGFTPEIIGVAPIATTNLLKSMVGDDGLCSVLLDIGARTTSLVIIEGEKFYNRSIPVAGNTITKEIAQSLGCTQEEAEQIKRENAYVSLGGVIEDEDETLDRISKVCRAVMTRLHAEISRSINFYRSQQGGSAPSKLYLTGGSSVLPQLAEFFQDSLGIEVEYLNPFATIGIGGSVSAEAIEADGSVLSATAGMALQSVGVSAITLNLMPQSILAAKAEVARIPFVAIGAIGFVAAAVMWFLAANDVSDEVEQQLLTATSQAAEAQATTEDVKSAYTAYDAAVAEAKKLMGELTHRDEALRHLLVVRDALDEGFWISAWKDEVKTIVVEDAPARGRVKAKTHEEISKFSSVTFRCWNYPREDRMTSSPLDVVVDRLLKTGACETVTKAAQGGYGPNSCLKEYTVVIKFKEAK